MRKIILSPSTPNRTERSQVDDYLDIERLAQVELSSEHPEFPIESALLGEAGPGWRAASSGIQTIRLVFDEPLAIKKVVLVFEETTLERTQEFVLRWSAENGALSEILRQQFHFSPPDTVQEIEQYTVNLSVVKSLELEINPGFDSPLSIASLRELRLA